MWMRLLTILTSCRVQYATSSEFILRLTRPCRLERVEHGIEHIGFRYGACAPWPSATWLAPGSAIGKTLSAMLVLTDSTKSTKVQNTGKMSSFDWIFFDCFNTLIDDFDDAGDESGVGFLAHLPVHAGFYSTSADFKQDYDKWRENQWSDGTWLEVILPDRFRAVLVRNTTDRRGEIEGLVYAMIKRFEQEFPKTLRLTPGVVQMLDFWIDKCRLAVVSNFFLPDGPSRYIQRFGLEKYFEFILDSSAFGWKKPSKLIYQHALGLANVPTDQANRVLFIGDSLRNDYIAPKQLGMQAVYFDRSDDRPGSIKASGDIFSIKHWDEFRSFIIG